MQFDFLFVLVPEGNMEGPPKQYSLEWAMAHGDMQNIAKPQLPWPSMAKVARTTSHRHRDLDFAIVATQHEHRRRETTYQTIESSKNFWL